MFPRWTSCSASPVANQLPLPVTLLAPHPWHIQHFIFYCSVPILCSVSTNTEQNSKELLITPRHRTNVQKVLKITKAPCSQRIFLTLASRSTAMYFIPCLKTFLCSCPKPHTRIHFSGNEDSSPRSHHLGHAHFKRSSSVTAQAEEE